MKIVITDHIRADDPLEPELAAANGIAQLEVLHVNGYGSEAEQLLRGKIEDADAIITYHETTLTRQTIQSLRKCQVISRGGVGFDNVDIQAARECGIPVCNVPDYGTEDVADTAFGMALTLARGISSLNNRKRRAEGTWHHEEPLYRLRGRVFGVVGLGRIGTATALRAKAFGMDVLFYDPYREEGADKAIGVRRASSLEDLLREAYIVSLHVPLTDETREMIDADTISLMPSGSYLINTARGQVVDTSAIPAAIASGRLAGAAVDVLPVEPPHTDDPLIVAWRDEQHPAHDRLIVNPHAAFYSEEGRYELRRKTVESCVRVLKGGSPRNVVN
ncbi:MAG: C-terminal binding protein [Planctomycetota bacterium]